MHVLVIGSLRASIRELMKLDCRVSWVNFSDNYEGGDGKYDVERFFVLKNKDQQALNNLVQYINTQEPVDHIVSFHDETQLMTKVAADAAGIECHISEAQVSLSRDKANMRERLTERGIFNHFHQKLTKQQVLDFDFRSVLPVVLKPLDGTGSEDVVMVKEASEVPLLLNKVNQSNFETFLVESLFEGDEYSVETMTVNSEHFLVGITRKYTNADSIEIGHVFPANLTQSQNQQIQEYVFKCLTALEFKSGPGHTEIILTEQGPQIIETHTRTGGDDIPLLVEECTDMNIPKLVAMQAVGLDILEPLQNRKQAEQFACIWFAAPSLEGQLQAAQFPAIEGSILKKYDQYLKAGDRLRKINHSDHRFASVRASGADYDEVVAQARKFVQDITLSITNIN